MARRPAAHLLLLAIAAALLPAVAVAQLPQRLSRTELEQMGRLCHTQLSIDARDARVKDIVAALREATGANFVITRSDDVNGLDPELRISLRAEAVTALDVVELMLDRAALFSPLTWQVRSGWIELGSREELARHRVVRTYDTEDLIHAVPYFEPPLNFFLDQPICSVCMEARERLENDPYSSAAVALPGANQMHPMTDLCTPTPDEELQKLLRLIIELVDPWNWDWPARASARGTDDRPDPRRIAHLRLHQHQAVVRAPAYMHRAFDGMPRSPVPRFESGAAMQMSSLASSVAPEIRVTVHGATESSTHLPGPDVLLQEFAAAEVDLTFDQVPLRSALEQMATATGVPIVGRYDDDPVNHGLNPELPVSWSGGRTPALAVLEALLDQHVAYGDATWQRRLGYIEVSTHERLSVPAARVLRHYDVTDLLIDVPNDPLDCTTRRLPIELAVDLIDTVVNTIEPGAWDYGQSPQRDTDLPLLRDTEQPTTPEERRAQREARRQLKPAYRTSPFPATIRYWRGNLLVLAPDYIHRQLSTKTQPRD